jgi:hypothetical protein
MDILEKCSKCKKNVNLEINTKTILICIVYFYIL